MNTCRSQRAGAEPHLPVWLLVVLLATCLGLVHWTWSLSTGTFAARYHAVPIAQLTFLTVQALCPRARWDRDRVVGPGNVALMLFALQLLFIPAMLVAAGPAPGVLEQLPPDRFVNLALVLQSVAYICFALGYVARRPQVRPHTMLSRIDGRASTIVVVFVALGVLALALRFATPGALLSYFVGRAEIFDRPEATTVADAAGTFLQPFLSYGLVIVWSVLITRRASNRRSVVAVAIVALLIVAASATYDYNRASAVIPILALVTTYHHFGRRVSGMALGLSLVVLALLAFQFGEYRSGYLGTQGGRISAADAALSEEEPSLAQTLQLYGNGPQFWAVTVQEVERSGVIGGETIVGSLLLPVPVLGAPFRADSGPAAYNELIYGRTDVADQILGFGAELYWNFGLGGIVVGFLGLGVVIRQFDAKLAAARDPVAMYSWAFVGVWAALMPIYSLSILSQAVVYFTLPIVAMFAIARVTSLRSEGART